MSENPSQTFVYRVKNPALPPTLRQPGWSHGEECHTVRAIGSSSKGPSAHRRLNAAPRASPVIDLNKACEPVIFGANSVKFRYLKKLSSECG